MGGVSFRTDRTESIDWNSFNTSVWWSAVKASNEEAIVNNAKCPFDEGHECLKRGCLQEKEGGQRGWTMEIKACLLSTERTLEFIKAHPEKLPDQQTVEVYNGVAISRMGPCDLEISSGEGKHDEFYPGIVFGIPLLEKFIEQIKEAIDKGANSITMLDRMTDADLYPCPRSWWIRRIPSPDEIDKYLKEDGFVPAAIIEEEPTLSYDEAIEKQKNGEWKAMIDAVFS